eukprot:TRINITY_DN9929_c0_g1_i4.p1 TRINITY_DN9929_c0_g1~~TRINITY_DN9929_c0_g1_i4.p1  ORF type:complete len:344 (+),score=55.70 TRINITY_DN9929_c0_g1_i4:43-1032(+)
MRGGAALPLLLLPAVTGAEESRSTNCVDPCSGGVPAPQLCVTMGCSPTAGGACRRQYNCSFGGQRAACGNGGIADAPACIAAGCCWDPFDHWCWEASTGYRCCGDSAVRCPYPSGSCCGAGCADARHGEACCQAADAPGAAPSVCSPPAGSCWANATHHRCFNDSSAVACADGVAAPACPPSAPQCCGAAAERRCYNPEEAECCEAAATPLRVTAYAVCPRGQRCCSCAAAGLPGLCDGAPGYLDTVSRRCYTPRNETCAPCSDAASHPPGLVGYPGGDSVVCPAEAPGCCVLADGSPGAPRQRVCFDAFGRGVLCPGFNVSCAPAGCP